MNVYVVTVDDRPDCVFASRQVALTFIKELKSRQPGARIEMFELRMYGEDPRSLTSDSAASTSRKLR